MALAFLASLTIGLSSPRALARTTAVRLRAPGASHARSALVRMSGNKAGLPTSEEGWRTVLSPDQFRVLRQKGTEPPGFSESRPGELEYELKKTEGTKYPESGAYECVACGSPLYYARSKFASGCGWPAYYAGIPGAIKEVPDRDGRLRAEGRRAKRACAIPPAASAARESLRVRTARLCDAPRLYCFCFVQAAALRSYATTAGRTWATRSRVKAFRRPPTNATA